ncbi:hypothetical protein F5148DRAFT_97849 [Russula earlei]|uniref:Uncharacterized protein n=1 Tax=Russula earlei TaxID=71964 RepID=A0ACC0UKA6_9AGAM|nr:hypothetical protein F5148DRAFT_97849 [Russula earlei]
MPDSPTALMVTTSTGVTFLKSTLAAGIVGLFIQGLEIGLVITQFSTWLTRTEHKERHLLSIIAFFVTAVGFLQTGIYFSTIWRIYVDNFGRFVVGTWAEKVHVLLTTAIAAPVQSLLISRCFNILPENLRPYIIIPLVLLLLGSIVLSILVTAGMLLPSFIGGPPNGSPPVWPPFLLYLTFPTVLDMVLCYILFNYLTQTRKKVFEKEKRRGIGRLITNVWQSAIPPTLCSVGVVITYLATHRFLPRSRQLWYPTLQAMTGKLYVLSLLHNLNVRTLFAGEETEETTGDRSLTLPAINYTHTSGLDPHDVHQPAHDFLSVTPRDEEDPS